MFDWCWWLTGVARLLLVVSETLPTRHSCCDGRACFGQADWGYRGVTFLGWECRQEAKRKAQIPSPPLACLSVVYPCGRDLHRGSCCAELKLQQKPRGWVCNWETSVLRLAQAVFSLATQHIYTPFPAHLTSYTTTRQLFHLKRCNVTSYKEIHFYPLLKMGRHSVPAVTPIAGRLT